MKVRVINKSTDTSEMSLGELEECRFVAISLTTPFFLRQRRSGKWVWQSTDFWCFASGEFQTKREALVKHKADLNVFDKCSDMLLWLACELDEIEL